ncbi:MAG: hypothetical protein U1E27_02920 [Kiritimatiellia bacterium]|nr:hypothetical protein [Kiritimatiellia bacterium]
MTEDEIIAKQGSPIEETNMSYESMGAGDIVRHPIQVRLKRFGMNGDKPLDMKEMVYADDRHTLLVWMIRNAENQWVCIGDLLYPKGVVY